MSITDAPRNLVCGVDSGDSCGTLETAALLADRLGLELVLVHSPHSDRSLVGEPRRRHLEEGNRLLDELDPADRSHSRSVMLDDPAHLLQAVAQDAALVVTGSRGRGVLRGALFGSVSQTLVETAPCPVVVVPRDAEPPDPADRPAIVCGLDGSAASLGALAAAEKLAFALGGRLTIVHVPQPEPDPTGAGALAGLVPIAGTALDRGAAALAVVERAVAALDTRVPVSMRVETGDPAEALCDAAARHASAMLVVGSARRGAVLSALLGSVASRLSRQAPVPVMVVPEGARPLAGGEQPLTAAGRSG